MGRPPRHRLPRRRVLAAAFATLAVVLLPGMALAHPLGNFTINHYAGIMVSPDAIDLDVVIDEAEIPAFESRRAIDIDGDGTISRREDEIGRAGACADLSEALDLRIDGIRQTVEATAAAITFPPGAGGLSTMRLTCAYRVERAGLLAGGASITFADGSDVERIGWREIVVQGAGVALTGDALRPSSRSARLTSYPPDLLASPLDDRSVAFTAVPAAVAEPAPAAAPSPAAVSPGSAAVPGGAGDLPAIFRAADLTPVVLLVSLLTAAALGAGHAVTPGHGKTLMAAYLVGTRGTPLHAVGLGLSVTVSHTLGILALAAVVVAAQGVLAPDIVVRGAPIVAAVSIVVIGAWMLVGEIRRRRSAAAHARAHQHDLEHAHPRPHDHGPAGEHRHGSAAHSHVPPSGSTITWRGLFALGLAGGLIPSTSALLILLGAIAAGRPWFGVVLIVAFGLGMAAVMTGTGLALVFARARLDRMDAGSRVGRVGAAVPLVAAVVVLGLGCYLAIQAVGGAPAL